MKLTDYLQTRMGAIRENAIARYIILALGISNLILIVALLTKDQTVVVIPSDLSVEARISSKNANNGLKEAWANQVAMMLGNVTPRTAPYLTEQLGKVASPAAYKDLMEGVADQAKRISDEHLTVQFVPTQVFALPQKGDVVVVSGEYTLRGLRDAEQHMVRTYEVGIAIRNFAVQVTSINVYEGPWSPDRDKRLDLQKARDKKANAAATADASTGST